MTDMDELIAGLEILRKYDTSGGDVSMNYERFLFAGPTDDDAEDKVTDADTIKLEELGWAFDERVGRWSWC